MNEFFRCLLGSNPFAGSAVSRAGDAAVHVESVHQQQFHKVVTCVRQVQSICGHQGLVLWGEAGIGKSHLLAHVCRWAERDGGAYCFVLRSLPANPAAVPWSIIRSVMRQMTRPQHADTRGTGLGRLVRKAIEQAMAELALPAQPYRAGHVRLALRRLVGRRLHNRAARVETLMICDLLFHSLVGRGNRAARSALGLLSGESLDASEAAELGVRRRGKTHGPVRLSQIASAQSVLVALASLASLDNRATVLLCDQVDLFAPEQFRALAQFLGPLTTHARNLLVILSGRQQTILERVEDGVIARAVWDRFAHDDDRILLPLISNGQARQVLDARLHSFLEPFLTLSTVRRRVAQDPLFPLGGEWFDERTRGLSEFRTRDVIQWAEERWKLQQAKIHGLSGPTWLEECCPGRSSAPGGSLVVVSSQVPAPAPACLARESALAPASTPQPTAALVPSQVSVPEVAMHRSSPPERESRKLEFGAWAITAVNFVALLLLLCWPSPPLEDSRKLAQRESGTLTAAGSPISGRMADEAADPDTIQALRGDEKARGATLSVRSPAGPPAAPVPTETLGDQALGKTSPREFAQAPPADAAPRVTDSAQTTGQGRSPSRVASASVASSEAPATTSLHAMSDQAMLRYRQAVSGGSAAAIPTGVTPGNVARPAGRNARFAARRGASTGGNAQPTGRSTPSASRGETRRPATTGSQTSPVRPIAIVDDPVMDRLLNEAWGLIDRGDYGPGRLRLLEARTANYVDPRADFSLGLLAAVIDRDWDSAEQYFNDCVRRDRENVPSLNNLAVAQVFRHDEEKAVSAWKTIVDQDAATPEVVQNLGMVRHLVEQGEIRRKNALVRSLDRVYTDAAVATASSYQVKTGFHMMALRLPDGSLVGWANAQKMQGLALSADAPPSSPTEVPPRLAPHQAAPMSGGSEPVPFAPGIIDPRIPHYPYYNRPYGVPWMSAPGYAPPGTNVPVLPQRRAVVPGR